MKKLFNVLSIAFLLIGLLCFMGGEPTVGMFFTAAGMVGIGIAAYNR